MAALVGAGLEQGSRALLAVGRGMQQDNIVVEACLGAEKQGGPRQQADCRAEGRAAGWPAVQQREFTTAAGSCIPSCVALLAAAMVCAL